MAKLTLSNLTNLENQQTAINVINNNSDLIETALENTFSRDGTSPNEMNADLDMNSRRILNLPEPISDTEPVRFVDVDISTITTIQGLVDEAEGYRDEAEGFRDEAETISNNVEQFVDDAETAQLAAEAAQGFAEAAQTAAETAQGLAESAKTAAETAKGLAESAQTGAETAQGLAESAQTAAETAQGLAEDAQSAAEAAQAGAETAEGNADGYAQAAAQSAIDAANAWDDFDDVYLGTKTSDPTLDNDGNPLTTGQLYFNSISGNLRIYDGTVWQIYTAASGLAGVGSSVDGEVVLFDGTSGDAVKRATQTGILKATSGVLGTATSGTDYAPATSGTSILKGSGSGGFSNATAGTDYLAPPSGSAMLKANSGGALANATDGTDYLSPSTGRKQGKETIWMPASAMVSRSTNGAGSGSAEMSTNKNMVKTLDFDTSTQEFAQFEIAMPKSWNLGTVTFQPIWSHPSTTTNFGVVWGLQAVARSDDDTLDVAFGTEQTSTDTGGTTNDLYVGPESSAITVAGSPAAGDVVQFQIKRNVSDGSDTMAVDARLHGIRLYYTVNAADDT